MSSPTQYQYKQHPHTSNLHSPDNSSDCVQPSKKQKSTPIVVDVQHDQETQPSSSVLLSTSSDQQKQCLLPNSQQIISEIIKNPPVPLPEFIPKAHLKTLATVITDRVGNALSLKDKVLSIHHHASDFHIAAK